MNKRKSFLFNGLLITAVSLFMRTVSVGFNVYISNKIGAVAMGVFTLITTVYGFAITVATSGISLAATRHIAEAVGESGKSGEALKKDPSVRCIVRKCVVYALCFSIGAASVLFLFAPLIGKRLLSDERTVSSLRVLAITLPPIALSSVFSGYFIAVRRVYKNAIVQVFGQGVKIFSCIALFSFFSASDVESACLSVVLGGTAAEILSFGVQYLMYLLEKQSNKEKKVSAEEAHSAWKKVLHTSLPVAFSAYMRSGLITVEHMLIPWGLEHSGSSRDLSLAAYGTVHSMVFPLVLFPSALSGSFASLLIPEVAESCALGDKARIERIINKVFSSVLIYSIGVAGIMMCFSYELSEAVYPSADAGKFVLMVAPLIPIMYLDTSVDGILKGLGEQVYCMGVNIVDALLSVILVWILLPKMGIAGYILTVYFTEIINATLSIARLFTVMSVRPKLMEWVAKPIISIISSCALSRFVADKFTGSITGVSRLTSYIILTTVVYLALLWLMKARKKEQRR